MEDRKLTVKEQQELVEEIVDIALHGYRPEMDGLSFEGLSGNYFWYWWKGSLKGPFNSGEEAEQAANRED